VPSLFEFVSPQAVESFLALAIGFAVAGLISTGYQLVTERPASFRLLEQGPHPATFAAIPFLVFAAPFIIMRNTIRGRRLERRRMEFVMIATVIAGVWSLMSGTVVVMAFEQIARVVG
jgi:O-antigen/teichoic acid export membrane protein